MFPAGSVVAVMLIALCVAVLADPPARFPLCELESDLAVTSEHLAAPLYNRWDPGGVLGVNHGDPSYLPYQIVELGPNNEVGAFRFLSLFKQQLMVSCRLSSCAPEQAMLVEHIFIVVLMAVVRCMFSFLLIRCASPGLTVSAATFALFNLTFPLNYNVSTRSYRFLRAVIADRSSGRVSSQFVRSECA
jgi:hypothetical protein